MSYREYELEEAYDKLEDQYWELVEWLKVHAPLTLLNTETEKRCNYV